MVRTAGGAQGRATPGAASSGLVPAVLARQTRLRTCGVLAAGLPAGDVQSCRLRAGRCRRAGECRQRGCIGAIRVVGAGGLPARPGQRPRRENPDAAASLVKRWLNRA